MILVLRTLLLSIFSYLPTLSLAAEAAVSEPFSIQSLTQLVLGLLFVIALILFLAWALRRLNAIPGQTGKMRVVASMPLGTRERAVLVQIGEEQLLLGVTSQSVNLLARYETPVISAEQVGKGQFANRLAEILQQRGKR